MSIAAIPVSHTADATGTQSCNGFMLASGAGASEDSAIAGFTASFTIGMPESIRGAGIISTFCGTVSALGTKLALLSMDMGRQSLIATSAHSAHTIHFGARFISGLATITAKMSQLAVIERFTTPKKNSLILSHRL